MAQSSFRVGHNLTNEEARPREVMYLVRITQKPDPDPKP